MDGSVVYVIDEDEDNDSTSSDSRCPCNFQATRWSGTLNAERVVIWEPRPRTRNCPLPPALQHPHLHKRHKTRLLSNIFHCAGSTADTLVAASTSTSQQTPHPKSSPSSTRTLQACVAVLSDALTYQPRALVTLEKELQDSLRAIYITIRGAFAKADEESYKREIGELMKLCTGPHARRDRITRWTEDVMTSSSGPMHPMAFAMMFGNKRWWCGVNQDLYTGY